MAAISLNTETLGFFAQSIRPNGGAETMDFQQPLSPPHPHPLPQYNHAEAINEEDESEKIETSFSCAALPYTNLQKFIDPAPIVKPQLVAETNYYNIAG